MSVVTEEPQTEEERTDEEQTLSAPDHDETEAELFDKSDYDREDLALPKVDGEATDKIAVKFSGTVLLDRTERDWEAYHLAKDVLVLAGVRGANEFDVMPFCRVHSHVFGGLVRLLEDRCISCVSCERTRRELFGDVCPNCGAPEPDMVNVTMAGTCRACDPGPS